MQAESRVLNTFQSFLSSSISPAVGGTLCQGGCCTNIKEPGNHVAGLMDDMTFIK